MLSKNQVKFVTSLAMKKFRSEHGLFIAEGVKIVNELLRSSIVVKQVFGTKEFLSVGSHQSSVGSLQSSVGSRQSSVNSPQSSGNGEPEVIEVSGMELQKISQLTTPNQVLAVAEIPRYELKNEELHDRLTLVLDDVRDPGNLGTIIRIADWFGISDVVCSQTSADAWNPKVVQATMGSIARIKVHYTDLEKFLPAMELPVYGAVLEGDNIYSKKLQQKGLIVIGNESRGISDAVLTHVTDKITIPNYSGSNPLGEAESLNAAIATAVICAEFRR